MKEISKTEFKAHALEILRNVEQSGQTRIITNHGKPTLELRKLRKEEKDPLEILKGTVAKYVGATSPLNDDWENS